MGNESVDGAITSIFKHWKVCYQKMHLFFWGGGLIFAEKFTLLSWSIVKFPPLPIGVLTFKYKKSHFLHVIAQMTMVMEPRSSKQKL